MRSNTETGSHMKQILLHPNSSKQGIRENCRRVFDALTECGAQVVALDEDRLFFEGKSPSAILPRAEAVRRADIAVVADLYEVVPRLIAAAKEGKHDR